MKILDINPNRIARSAYFLASLALFTLSVYDTYASYEYVSSFITICGLVVIITSILNMVGAVDKLEELYFVGVLINGSLFVVGLFLSIFNFEIIGGQVMYLDVKSPFDAAITANMTSLVLPVVAAAAIYLALLVLILLIEIVSAIFK